MANENSMEMSTIFSSQQSKCCLEVREAFKRYGNDTVVLQGLNMTVKVGEIYALLGSSGSGKSTLLNCVLGQCKLDYGSVSLNVNRRSHIGFMPQEICLHKELSIYENMFIFGYLNGMTKERIFTRANEMIQLLQLPSGDKYVGTLSGGEQRRVSLAIAFLHNPSILILDEPTVGLDVELTRSVWNYFQRMAALGRTLIITTHYIQEAHRAQTVGILRRGIVMVEENPQSLMERFGGDTLEDVFLTLSREQEAKGNLASSSEEKHFPSDGWQLERPHFTDDDKKVSVVRMKSVFYKNAVQLSRNYAFLMTIMIIPIVQILIFHLVFGGSPKKLKIGFVNDEVSARDCNYNSYTDCALSNDNYRLSCVFMDLFRNETYELKEYSDEASAVRAVKENEVWAALHFAKNYTQQALQFFEKNEAEKNMSNFRINYWVDLSSHFIGSLVKRDIFEYFEVHLEIALKQCNMSPKRIQYPGGISFQPSLNAAGDRESAVMSSSVPSLLMILGISIASTAAAMIGTEEKLAGTITRMQAAGLSLYEFLISLLAIQIILHVLRTFSTIILLYWILGYEQRGDIVVLIVLMFCIGLLGILFGIVCSVMTTNPTVTMIAQNGIAYYVSFSTGFLWPIEGQANILRFFNYFFPFTWLVSAAQEVSLRGISSLTNKIVLQGFGMTFVWIIIFVFIVGYILKYKSNALVSK